MLQELVQELLSIRSGLLQEFGPNARTLTIFIWCEEMLFDLLQPITTRLQ